MARKNNSRSEAAGSIHFDSRTKTVMANTGHDNVKEKVQSIREVVPGKSNNEVVLVLQYYDYNVERAIQAYIEDGAKEALQEWNFTGTKKRKNKKKANDDKPGSAPSATNGKRGAPAPINGKAGLPNGDISHDPTETDSPLDSPTLPTPMSLHEAAETMAETAKQATALPQRQHSKGRGHGDYNHASHNHHCNRERTVSEVSATSGFGDGHRKPFHGLDKALKDLQRQTNSLERLHHVLDHEIDRSYKSLKTVFEELRMGLGDREFQLMAEMDMLKKEASAMLLLRQDKAAELKRQVERAECLKDTEVSELRAQIKLFVSDRRHNDDLGRTTRFLYDSDHLMQQVRKFGEVVHVKPYGRCLSTSSVASSGLGHEEHLSESDLGQSHEEQDLQDRLKHSLKLQTSPTCSVLASSHLASSQNGLSHSGNNSPSRQRRGGQQHLSQSGGQRVSGEEDKAAAGHSHGSKTSHQQGDDHEVSDHHQEQHPHSNTGSPSRGRRRGRGGAREPGGSGVRSQQGEWPQYSQGSHRPPSVVGNCQGGRS